MTRGSGGGPGKAGRRFQVRGPAGCLLWVVALAFVLLLLSILFGGFQRGTKAAPAPRPDIIDIRSLHAVTR